MWIRSGGQFFNLRNQSDVALDGEVRKQSNFLDYVADHAAQADYIPVARGTRLDEEFAVARREETIDEFESRSFAGAAATEQDQGFSAVHFEIQIVEQFAAVRERDCRFDTDTWRNSMAGRVSGESFMLVVVVSHPKRCYGTSYAAGGQAGDANSGVAFVADVQADQQRGDLLQDARIFQFAAVEGANAGNFCGQDAHDLAGFASSLQTITSQSTGSSPFSSSAETF